MEKVSDKAVEMAAEAIWNNRPASRLRDGSPTPWGELKDYQTDRHRESARAALGSAYPELKRQAIIELAEEAKAEVERVWPSGVRMSDLPEADVHAYDRAMFAARWLVARAAKEEF